MEAAVARSDITAVSVRPTWITGVPIALVPVARVAAEFVQQRLEEWEHRLRDGHEQPAAPAQQLSRA
jgi:hypothetical protein